VKEGHTGAVMDSYNLINGEHATQNKFLNIQVLRKDWGFNGIVMSDWGATHSTVDAANGGMDLEMPDGEYFNEKDLMAAIKSGKVTEATIDTKVQHILQTALRFGFFDRPQLDLNIPKYDHQSQAVALQSAEESAVLLKNENHLLPLDRAAVHSLAVLGPNAYPAVASAGGSAHVTAIDPVSFMTGLSNALYPKTKVYWNSGLMPVEDVFKSTHWCADPGCQVVGLHRGEYITSTDGERLASTVDKTVINNGGSWLFKQTKSAKKLEWYGYFVPKTSGDYILVVSSGGGRYNGHRDHYEVKVGGKPAMSGNGQQGGSIQSATITLQAGKPVLVVFNYFLAKDSTGAPSLGIVAADKVVDPEAIQLAKMADDVVLCVGFDKDTESEGFDRTYDLPFGQEQLIQAITAANPRTIVVLTAGGAVATQKWLNQVPVLLQTWYGGSEGGTALAKLLFGQIDPSGKLPISWAKTIQDNPAYDYYYEKPGSRDVKYDDGIFQGYRYYETSAVKPLFPFGFGMSYTTFAFSNLSVSPMSASPNGPITVGFDVKNTGRVAGAEVAQVYVGDPSATVKRPKMELKGFSRVMLQPGQTRHVTVKLDKRSLAFWDVNTHGWKVDPGKFVVYVGDAVENVPLQKSFSVQ
jgi:beta-glucosidase